MREVMEAWAAAGNMFEKATFAVQAAVINELETIIREDENFLRPKEEFGLKVRSGIRSGLQQKIIISETITPKEHPFEVQVNIQNSRDLGLVLINIAMVSSLLTLGQLGANDKPKPIGTVGMGADYLIPLNTIGALSLGIGDHMIQLRKAIRDLQPS